MPQQPEKDQLGKSLETFYQFLLVVVSRCCRGYAYNACVHSVLLYASETWAATQEDVSRLNRNDMMMIRWICSAKLRDKVPSEELRSRLGLGSIENALRCGRLRWYGHVQRMDPDTWPRIGKQDNRYW